MAMSIASSMPCASTALRKPMSPSSPPSSGATVSWPPSAEPMAYGEPGSVGSRLEGVVAPLAVRPPDRVDRRQVDDVESHRRDVGKPPLGFGEGRGGRPLRIAALGAREQLVPRTEPSALAVDDERELRAIAKRSSDRGDGAWPPAPRRCRAPRRGWPPSARGAGRPARSGGCAGRRPPPRARLGQACPRRGSAPPRSPSRPARRPRPSCAAPAASCRSRRARPRPRTGAIGCG